MKRILKAFSASLLALSFVPALALAQTSAGLTIAMPTSSLCLTLPYNLRVGDTDYARGGTVTNLQTYLASQGYFSSSYIGSGRFGPLTMQATARFQAAYGLPATGYVGPLTRALIQKISCGGSVVPPTQGVSIYSLSPSAGAPGTSVTISGYNLTNSNTILFDGSVIASNVSLNPVPMIACLQYDANCIGNRQSVTFVIPEYTSPCPPGAYCIMMAIPVTPGPHSISVQNSNGTSNSLTFQVTAKSAGGGVSINGLDAPTSLTIGQQGTWTVRVSGSQNTGDLRYSVLWGDEYQGGAQYIMAPQDSTVQSSATFTHTYRISGTYRPTFTVTKSDGSSNTVSATVLVNPIY